MTQTVPAQSLNWSPRRTPVLITQLSTTTLGLLGIMAAKANCVANNTLEKRPAAQTPVTPQA